MIALLTKFFLYLGIALNADFDTLTYWPPFLATSLKYEPSGVFSYFWDYNIKIWIYLLFLHADFNVGWLAYCVKCGPGVQVCKHSITYFLLTVFYAFFWYIVRQKVKWPYCINDVSVLTTKWILIKLWRIWNHMAKMYN